MSKRETAAARWQSVHDRAAFANACWLLTRRIRFAQQPVQLEITGDVHVSGRPCGAEAAWTTSDPFGVTCRECVKVEHAEARNLVEELGIQ